MDRTGVAIVGLGTVGCGVARLLLAHGDRCARHAGRSLWLTHAVVRDLNRTRDCELPAGVLTDDLDKLIADKSVTVVAQLIGGIDDAREIMLRLLASGKDIVTANKALLAEHGPELFETARRLNRSIAFEASVAGGIPIINTIGQSLSANQILSLRGILNGTSNYIVSRMGDGGTDYETALAQAQRLGFAESDATHDIDGSDVSQKLAILTQLAFGTCVGWRDIPRRGIDAIDPLDYAFAGEMGYRIKLIAQADLLSEGLRLSIAPMLVRIGEPLAEVRGNFNAISVVGDAVGPVFLYGQGAGQMPTASAVVADMIDTAVGRTAITFRNLERWSSERMPINVNGSGNQSGRFYLRFDVEDQPGSLAQIARILGEHAISIASVCQHDSVVTGAAGMPVVIMTKSAPENSLRIAVEQIANLSVVRDNHQSLRILE